MGDVFTTMGDKLQPLAGTRKTTLIYSITARKDFRNQVSLIFKNYLLAKFSRTAKLLDLNAQKLINRRFTVQTNGKQFILNIIGMQVVFVAYTASH